MDNLNNLFSTNIRISSLDPLETDAIFPHGIEICLTRVPIRKRDGYDAEKLREIIKKIKNNMVKNGVMFLICYAPTECKGRPFEVANIATSEGFNHIDNIVIEKTWLPGKRSENNLVNSHEYVLFFCNGNVWKLDRLPIKDYLKSDDELSCPGNTWKVETGSLDESYSFDLAELLITMADVLPGSIIFDPFGGTTSALEVALKLGHSYYGFEKNERKLKKINKIISEFSKTKKIFKNKKEDSIYDLPKEQSESDYFE